MYVFHIQRKIGGQLARNFGILAFQFLLVRFVVERCGKKNNMATMLSVPAI